MNSLQLTKKQQKIAHLIEKGKLKEAIKPLLQLCKLQPDNTQLWLKLASLYGQTNDFQSVIKVCRKIEPTQQHNPILHSLLGNAYASLNNMEKAHECYQQALELQPNDPGLLNNLGNALYLDNKLDEAAEIFQRVITLSPNYADAHNNLGNIYKALNDDQLAIKHYQQAIKLNPHLYQTQLNLAHMFADRIGHPEIAEDYFRKALAIEPDNIEALSGVSNMLRYQGKLDEALDMIKQTQQKFKNEPGPIAAEADIYERSGNYDGAYKIIRDMLCAKTAPPMIINVFMRICHRYDSCDEAISEAEKLTNNTTIKIRDLQDTHFGLGKLYDKQKKYDDAFAHYKKGNEALDIYFEPEVFRARVENLITTFNKDNLSKLAKSSINTSKPIFILGMPRSGTSLTEQILSSHPEVDGAGELNDINDIMGSLSKTLQSPLPYPQCVTSLTTDACNHIAQGYLNRLTNLCGDNRFITDKMPHNFLNIGLISLLFPQAKIIHCVRDPRDICLSIFFQNFGWLHPYGTRLDWLGSYFQEYVRIMKHWEHSVDIPVYTVRYDDMVNDQEATTRNLLAHCGLEWNDACLDFHKSERVVATASYDQVRQKIYTKSQARWKKYEKHIAPLVEHLGDALDGWPS
ncbi:MAG: sulfotransferase [Gammaproteobacteria bacterium]|nr:sulfotransferase [Gammaproteobacteria bacterium]